MMHILVLADPLDNQQAGIHFYTKNLIEGLIEAAPKNKYTFIHIKENSFFNDKEEIILPYKNFPGYKSYRKFYLIPKIIKKLKPDAVIEPSHLGPFGVPKEIKKVTLIHDLTPILYPKYHQNKSARTHRLLLPRIFKNSDLILTPSDRTKQDIKNYYNPKSPIETIHAGINQNVIRSKNRPIKEPYILYLGTIEPRKNLQMLAEVYKELKRKKNIPHKLVLVGGIGWKIKSILPELQNKDIIMTDYIPESEKSKWYQHAEMFIYPSFYEGFGLPPLEAMSYGIPVICSTGGSLKEIYQENALMFDPHNREELKSQIKRLIENPTLKNEYSKKGKEFASKMTWKNTAQKTLTAIENLF